MGTISRGNMKGNSLAGAEDAVPVWMWYDPASVLQAYGCDLTQADVKESGSRLLLAFKDRTHRQLVAHVEVDRQPPHVVYRIERKGNNKTIVDCQLVYDEQSEPGDELGPALKSWTYWRFGAGTTWETRRQGYVSQLVCPAKLTNDDFTFEFPVGTHIAESKSSSSNISWTHWLQTSPTERRRFKQGEFGRADVTR